jgi:hypothetical protein
MNPGRPGPFSQPTAERRRGSCPNGRNELDAVPAAAFLHDTMMRNVIVSPAGTLSDIGGTWTICALAIRATEAG